MSTRHLGEVLPWVDSMLVEVPDWLEFHRGVELPNQVTFNHAYLGLRQPFQADGVLACLAQGKAFPCLRTLTLSWPLVLTRRVPGRGRAELAEDFLARLLAFPLTVT